jgi:pimeloyl-ACP methyl ester carboxylesterase
MQQLMPIGRDQVWVEDSGGDGPTVLLLHLGVGDSTAYDDIWPALTAQARCLRFDYRAYGRSPAATEPWTIVGDALAVLDGHGVERAHLVGNSMGGGAALDLAVLHPERVASLVLLGPGVNGYPWPDDDETESAEFERLVATRDEDGLVEFMLRIWAASGREPRIVDLVRRAVRAMPNDSEFEQSTEPTYERLGEIAVPTVMVIGEIDAPDLVAANHAAAERIPGCRTVLMPGVDHYMSIREPDWVLRLVLEQLGG